MFEFFKDATKLAVIVAFLYFAFTTYVRRRRTSWKEHLEERRLAVLSILVLSILAIKTTEDALSGDSGPFDKAMLLFIHEHAPGALTAFFEMITLTGSSKVLFPLATLATASLFFARRRFEALLLAASTLAGALTIYIVKATAGRVRPELWDTEWYWGSSFPSGHTLAVAAFATAAAICAKRIRPALGNPALAIAIVWILSVAFSRLVLGVHWPTDVLAAACIGAFLPLAIGMTIELRLRGRLLK